MIYSLYSISLKFKTPSQEGKNINFKNKEKDLLDAVQEFNLKFRSWSKRIIMTNIEQNFFDLILIIEKHKDKVSTREIRTFTAYLNKEKNWYVYSRENSKLFEGVKFNKISINEAIDIISHMKDSSLYNLQEEDISFILNYKSQIKEKEVGDKLEEKSRLTNEINHDLSDEQAIAIFNYLIQTKKLGKHNKEKNETILQIKDLLINWL